MPIPTSVIDSPVPEGDSASKYLQQESISGKKLDPRTGMPEAVSMPAEGGSVSVSGNKLNPITGRPYDTAQEPNSTLTPEGEAAVDAAKAAREAGTAGIGSGLGQDAEAAKTAGTSTSDENAPNSVYEELAKTQQELADWKEGGTAMADAAKDMKSNVEGIATSFQDFITQFGAEQSSTFDALKGYLSQSLSSDKMLELDVKLKEASDAKDQGYMNDKEFEKYVNDIKVKYGNKAEEYVAPTEGTDSPNSTIPSTNFAANLLGNHNLDELDNLMVQNGENLNSMTSISYLLLQDALAVNENNNKAVKDYVSKYKSGYIDSYEYWQSSIDDWKELSEANLKASSSAEIAKLDLLSESLTAEKDNQLAIAADNLSRAEGYSRAVMTAMGVDPKSTFAMVNVSRQVNLANLNYAELASKYNQPLQELAIESARLQLETTNKISEIQLTANDRKAELSDNLLESISKLDWSVVESDAQKELNRVKLIGDHQDKLNKAKNDAIQNQLEAIKIADKRQQDYIENAKDSWKTKMEASGVLMDFDPATGAVSIMTDRSGNALPTLDREEFDFDRSEKIVSTYMDAITSGDLNYNGLTYDDKLDLARAATGMGLPGNTFEMLIPDANEKYLSSHTVIGADGRPSIVAAVMNTKTGTFGTKYIGAAVPKVGSGSSYDLGSDIDPYGKYYTDDFVATRLEQVGGGRTGTIIENFFGEDGYVITSDYGDTRTMMNENGEIVNTEAGGVHHGVDIASPKQGVAFAVKSFTNGTVIESPKDPIKGYGYTMVIEDSQGNKHRYSHLDETDRIKVGSTVNRGQRIALTGTSSIENSTGMHLDFRTHDANGNAIDPRKFMNSIEMGSEKIARMEVMNEMDKINKDSIMKNLGKTYDLGDGLNVPAYNSPKDMMRDLYREELPKFILSNGNEDALYEAFLEEMIVQIEGAPAELRESPGSQYKKMYDQAKNELATVKNYKIANSRTYENDIVDAIQRSLDATRRDEEGANWLYNQTIQPKIDQSIGFLKAYQALGGEL